MPVVLPLLHSEKGNLFDNVLLDFGAFIHHVPCNSVLHFLFDLFILTKLCIQVLSFKFPMFGF